MSDAVIVVMAKAPEPGKVKTRLAASVGAERAARLAAAALLDTMDACRGTFERCFLVLSGDLDKAVDRDVITDQTRGWTVLGQRGRGLGERLSNAHADVHAAAPAPTLQVAMDTPHVTPDLLSAAAQGLVARTDAVLGPAEDGGWWVLGLADPAAAKVLRTVPMSVATTGEATRLALEADGLDVRLAPTLRDVDTAEDAAMVALVAPWTRFAQEWSATVAALPALMDPPRPCSVTARMALNS